jgi:hypothetical protein
MVLILKEVAPFVTQLNVELFPLLMEVGEAAKLVMVGAPGTAAVTVTVAVALLEPAELVAVSV